MMRNKFAEVRALAEASVLELTGRRTSATEDLIDEVTIETLAADQEATLADITWIALQVIKSAKEQRARQGVA